MDKSEDTLKMGVFSYEANGARKMNKTVIQNVIRLQRKRIE